MVLGIQVVGGLFALFMLYITYLHVKRKEYTVKEYFFWTFFWIAFGIVSIFPQWLDPITAALRLTRTMDLFIIIGFMFLIGAVVYIYDVLRKTQRKVEDIVRKVAIEKAEKRPAGRKK